MVGIDIVKELEKAKNRKNDIIDFTKYNKLLDPNRETDKIKVEFLKDYSTYKKGDRRTIKTADFLLFSDVGACKSVEETKGQTIPAFGWFEEIDALPTIEEKHRALLKRYEGLNYTSAKNGKHEKGWNEHTPYDDSLYSETINKVGRKGDELTLEFDSIEGEPNNPKENLEFLKKILEHYGIGYVETSHESENSNHVHVEFVEDVSEEQAKDFIAWISPEGSRIDLNFCRDKFLFPVMYAEHWKYPGVREMPVKFFKGRKIDLAACKIPKQNVKSTIKVGADGFKYETYQRMSELPKIRIGGSGLLIGDVAKNIADVFSEHETLFYKQELREIVEVSKIKHDEEDKSFLGFSIIKPKRFITLSEKYFTPFVYTLKKDKETEKVEKIETPKSLTNDKANIILASPHFQEAMPVIKRIFSVPMPMMYDGKLELPKTGYDKRFYSWLNPNAPKIEMGGMNTKKAKELIEKMFKEFCFEKEQDYTNAIAGLITPFLRGIFPSFTTRTPMFFYVANRERAGKDYLASITGLALEGQALDEPPISDGENGGSSKNDELRKKLLSSLLQGRRRLHFANNKGRMNNSVLEAALTSKIISDRILGRNEVVSVENELDISASGNVGITFTPDLSNRCVFVKLFLDIENANDRDFETPDLHGWVMENRGEVLSAIFCLINDWVKNGMKRGSKRFASFPEWADICGGIMENAGFGSPCVPNDEALTIGGDTESQEMKQLFELAFAKYPEEAISKKQLVEMIKEDESLFSYFDWDKKADQGKFGKKLIRFYGRVFSDIRLSVVNPEDRTARQKVLFTKLKKVEPYQVGKVGKVGKEFYPRPHKIYNDDKEKTKSVLDGIEPCQPYQDTKIPVEIAPKVGKVDFKPTSEVAQNIKFCPKCNAPMVENKCFAGCE